MFINVFFLQWFFIRLAKGSEKKVTNFDMKEVSLMPDLSLVVGGKVDYKEVKYYAFLYWIVPLTGWWSDYKFIGSCNLMKISKTRKIK